MGDSFFSAEELRVLGLRAYGCNVKISRKCSIYQASSIVLGDNVRVDDFCILSGRIKIGNYVHVAAYSALYAGDIGIEIGDFSNISSRVAIYAISDDYSGNSMTNPMISERYKDLQKKKVSIDRHVIIGTGCTILPGVKIAEGSAVGSMSLVKKSTEPWTINAGIPAEKKKMRSKKLLEMEKEFSRGGNAHLSQMCGLLDPNKRRDYIPRNRIMQQICAVSC